MSKVKTQLVVEGKNTAGPAFKQAESQLTRLSGRAKAAGAVLTAAFAAGAGAAEFARRSAEAVVQMERMARLAGTNVETFQRWQFAARAVGMETDKIGDVFKDVQDKVGDFLQTGGGPLADFFENIAPKVGVTAEQFRNLSGPDALQLYVSSLEAANLSQSEMTFYMEAIANDATLLLPLLSRNGEEFQRLAKRAQEFGFLVSGKTAADAKEFAQNLDTLGLVGEATGKRLTAEMLPAMNDMTGLLLDVARDGEATTIMAEALGYGMKVLATGVSIAGANLMTFVRAMIAAYSATKSILSGDLDGAIEAFDSFAEKTEATYRKTIERVTKLWTGGYADMAAEARTISGTMQDVSESSSSAGEKANNRFAESYKNLVNTAKSALQDLIRAEQDANRDVEAVKQKRLEIEQRYALAIAKFNAGAGGEPSYAQAESLKVSARNALKRGDLESAQQQAQEALKILQQLSEAGENTYGFAGFAKELQAIEAEANGLEQTQADKKLASISEQVKALKAQLDTLEKVDVAVEMSAAAQKKLIEDAKKLAELTGQEFKDIPVTFKVPKFLAPMGAAGAGSDIEGFATGGAIRGPGTGTSDSILARLSNGEYVVRAAAVRKYGKNMLDRLNGMSLPKYADGGLVGNIQPASGGTPLHLTLDGQTFSLNGDSGTIEDLARVVRSAKLKRR